MNHLKTKNLRKKKLVNLFFNRSGYNLVKSAKIIVDCIIRKPYEISTILNILITPEDVVLDIGANMGQYACRLSRIVTDHGRIYSFEPVRSNFEALQRMKKILRLSNVEIFKLGVGNTVGELEIKIPKLDDGLIIATQATLSDLGEGINYEKEKIQVTTIDKFVEDKGIEKVDFIKCDTEGNEEFVVAGGMSTITKNTPILSLEAAHSESFLEDLYKIGYEPFFYNRRTKKLQDIRSNQEGNVILLTSHHQTKVKEIITG